MKIAIVGTGYVGLVSGVCFSELGFKVICVDKIDAKIQRLKNYEVPFFETNLIEYLSRNVKRDRLHFTTNLEHAVREAKAIFIAVGTPCDEKTGRADLTDLITLIKDMAPLLNDDKVIILKSTVPIGTGKKVQKLIKSINPKSKVHIAVNPEFLREGSAIQDFMKPDRIVIGTDAPYANKILGTLYHSFTKKKVPLIETTLETAECIKHAANAFLATKITFINQISDLCEASNGDIRKVAYAIGLDHRIGKEFLNPGPGFGGSCFPKDMQELIHSSQERNIQLTIIEAAYKGNKNRQKQMINRIMSIMGDTISGKTLAVLGLTFKANTDDLRDSPSLIILPALTKAGARVKAYDPKGMINASKYMDDVIFTQTAYEAMKEADALIILTEWSEFKNLDLERVKNLLKIPLIIDLRNIYSFEEMRNNKFIYHSLGNPPLVPNING